jgi:hypothetical protein
MRNLTFALVALVAVIATACGGSADTSTLTATATPEGTPTEPPRSIADVVSDANDGDASDVGSSTNTTPGGATVSSDRPTQLKLETPERRRIVQAIQATEALDSFQFDWSMTMDLAELGNFSIAGDGAVDPTNNAMSMTMDFTDMFAALAQGSSPEELELMQQFFGDEPVEIRYVGNTGYIRWPIFGLLLGAQTPWVAFEDPTGESGFDALSGSGGAQLINPSDMTAFLEDLWGIEEVGHETVRGVDTTHYRGVIDYVELMGQLSPDDIAQLEADLNGASLSDVFGDMPIEVWIDGDNVLRRLVLTIDYSNFGAAGATAQDVLGSMSMTYEVYNLGGAISIAAPPTSEVTVVDDSALLGSFGSFDLAS